MSEANGNAIIPVQNTITIQMPAVPTPSEVETLNQMCKIAAYSGFLNSTARDATTRAADAFFVMMYGRELGIPAMTSLKTIYVIDGKPSCSGQALLSLIRRGGVEVVIPDPGTIQDKATVKIKRPGGEWREYTYTEKMAEAAGLAGKPNWKKHKAEMLIWRAVSTASRFETPDIVGGLYTIEELAPDQDVDETGAPLRQLAQPTPPPVIQPTPEPEQSEPVPAPEADDTPPAVWGESEQTDFELWGADESLSKADLLTALDVSDFSEFQGGLEDAKAVVTNWLTLQVDDAKGKKGKAS